MAVENLEKLWLIGHMINLYRIENRKLYNDEYSIERFCEGICTRNTLKRIENGERCRESTYMNILSKFDLLFGDFPKIDEALLLMLDQLYNAIEFYDIPSVKEYCQKALTLLERVRNYVVYSELYMLFKDVFIFNIGRFPNFCPAQLQPPVAVKSKAMACTGLRCRFACKQSRLVF